MDLSASFRLIARASGALDDGDDTLRISQAVPDAITAPVPAVEPAGPSWRPREATLELEPTEEDSAKHEERLDSTDPLVEAVAAPELSSRRQRAQTDKMPSAQPGLEQGVPLEPALGAPPNTVQAARPRQRGMSSGPPKAAARNAVGSRQLRARRSAALRSSVAAAPPKEPTPKVPGASLSALQTALRLPPERRSSTQKERVTAVVVVVLALVAGLVGVIWALSRADQHAASTAGQGTTRAVDSSSGETRPHPAAIGSQRVRSEVLGAPIPSGSTQSRAAMPPRLRSSRPTQAKCGDWVDGRMVARSCKDPDVVDPWR